MDARLTSVKDILVRLTDFGASELESQATEHADLFDFSINKFPRADVSLVEKVFSSGDVASLSQFIYLSTVTQEGAMLPIVSFNFDFSNLQEMFRLRVGLIRLDDENKPTAVGLRFETPEPASGMHSYCHMQFVKNLGPTREGHVLPGDHWMPTTQPAIPLDAHDPVSLVVCFVVSLYGPNYLRTLVSAGSLNFMKSSVARMHGGEGILG